MPIFERAFGKSDKAKRDKPPIKHKKVVEDGTIRNIVNRAALSNDQKKKRMGLLIVLLFGGYLRLSEALNLLKSDVKLNGSELNITIRKSKTNQRGHPEVVYVQGFQTSNYCSMNK